MANLSLKDSYSEYYRRAVRDILSDHEQYITRYDRDIPGIRDGKWIVA